MHYLENLDLTSYNSYRIKSIAAKAYFPQSYSDIEQLLSQYPISDLVILGRGNNIILSNEVYKDKIFVFLHLLQDFELKNKTIIECGAGCSLKHISILAYGAQLTGMELFYDIPGSVGGALYMNAGANNEDILSLIKEILFYDFEANSIIQYKQKDLDKGYRQSCFQKKKGIILNALIELQKGDPEQILNKMQEIKQTRWQKQPRNYPNAGSVFKRPEGKYVGTMIEELGLKGFSVGGVKVSEKHAGFIVNFNNASGKDILKLIDIIKEKVYNKYSVELELEQKII